jgi:carboxyl-terminal processing protease
VYDKGGVEPDILTDEVVPHEILITLILNNLIFDFANQYHANNPEITEAEKFQITPEIYSQFQQFLKGKEYSYKSQTEALLEKLTEVATEEQYLEKIDPIIKQLNQAIEEEKERDLIKYQEEISQYLSMEIVTRYYYQKGKIVNQLVYDPDLKVAKQILLDQKRYQSILSGK